MSFSTNRISLALLACIVAATLPLGGCSQSTSEEPQAEAAPAEQAFPVSVTDDAGRDVVVEAEPERIVSLAPANTEIVAALGRLDRLVGVTTYCDYPPEVADIEKVGDFVAPNMEAITAAEPDLVLATTGVQQDVIEQLEGIGATVVAVDPQTLEGLYDSIDMVGSVLGASPEADELVADMQSGIDFVTETVSQESPASCFLEIAQDPLFTAGTGTLVNDLIAAAGGTNVVTEAGYVGYSLEQLLQDDPDVYLATKGSMSDPAQIESRAGYESLSAVQSGTVVVLDDNLVSRPGPRVVEGVGEIAVALHPSLFDDE